MRQRLEVRLAAVLWRFLGQHETHVAEAAGGRGRTLSLCWVYTRVIEEFARHGGHADLLRQRIDGAA